MVGYKTYFCVFCIALLPILAVAQNNTNSPYTRYGFGQLSDQNFGNSKAMGGVAYALRDPYHVNAMNPASYSAVDSLTFIFDGGLTLQNSNFSNGETKINAKNSSFDYIAMQFRLHPKLGISAGLLPYSNVGYSLNKIDNTGNSDTYNTITYNGEGGIHQLYVGAGYKILKNLSVGANLSYFWGNVSRSFTVEFPTNTNASSVKKLDYYSVKDVKLDLGVQYTYKLADKKDLTLGVTFSPGNDLNNDAYVENTTGSVVTRKDTLLSMGLPNTFGIGLAYTYDKRLTVGLDYTLQKWGDVTYLDEQNALADRSKISLGLEYLPSNTSSNYLAHIKYRLGAYYSEPYYKIEGKRAAKEYGVTGGLGIPFSRNRSVLSISAQYVRVEGLKQNLLNENCLRFSVGLTFNERWFFKRKVD